MFFLVNTLFSSTGNIKSHAAPGGPSGGLSLAISLNVWFCTHSVDSRSPSSSQRAQLMVQMLVPMLNFKCVQVHFKYIITALHADIICLLKTTWVLHFPYLLLKLFVQVFGFTCSTLSFLCLSLLTLLLFSCHIHDMKWFYLHIKSACHKWEKHALLAWDQFN